MWYVFYNMINSYKHLPLGFKKPCQVLLPLFPCVKLWFELINETDKYEL